MSENFNILTEEDRLSMAYRMCVLGQVGIGATLGSIAGGQTLLGAAGGAVWGLWTCKYLKEPIKQKLFGSTHAMSELEFRQALAAAKMSNPKVSKNQALEILATARHDASRAPAKYQC